VSEALTQFPSEETLCRLETPDQFPSIRRFVEGNHPDASVPEVSGQPDLRDRRADDPGIVDLARDQSGELGPDLSGEPVTAPFVCHQMTSIIPVTGQSGRVRSTSSSARFIWPFR